LPVNRVPVKAVEPNGSLEPQNDATQSIALKHIYGGKSARGKGGNTSTKNKQRIYIYIYIERERWMDGWMDSPDASTTALPKWNKLVGLWFAKEHFAVENGVEKFVLLFHEAFGAKRFGILPQLGVVVQ